MAHQWHRLCRPPLSTNTQVCERTAAPIGEALRTYFVLATELGQTKDVAARLLVRFAEQHFQSVGMTSNRDSRCAKSEQVLHSNAPDLPVISRSTGLDVGRAWELA